MIFEVPDQLWHFDTIESIESTCKMLPTSSKLSTSSPSGQGGKGRVLFLMGWTMMFTHKQNKTASSVAPSSRAVPP